MQVLVTGSSGLIGSVLTRRLEAGGHRVKKLVRSAEQTGGDAFFWNPEEGTLDEAALDGTDAVVHLAGETVAGRWTKAKKARIRDSRVRSTRLLSDAIVSNKGRPGIFVCASAVGYYGDRGGEKLTESSSHGEGFLARVVLEWETATEPAAQAGGRVVNLRSGQVLSAEGGALAELLRPFRLGLGGPIGRGGHYMSWISIADEVGAIEHALVTEVLSGPVNLVSPHPVTNRQFAKTLGRVLHRPAVLRTPLSPLRLAFGREFVEEVLLSSARAVPSVLAASGYRFQHDDLEAALTDLLRR